MVAIAGGHGKIALRLTQRLSARGEAVVGLIRNPDHADDVRAQGGQPVHCDLEHASDVAAVLDALLQLPRATRRILYVNAGEAASAGCL